MSSFRQFLDELPESDILRITEPIALDYVPTALVLELEEQQQFPVVYIENPLGFDMPVVANLFASRDRIARIAGADSAAGFNDAWLRAESRRQPPVVVDDGPVQELVFHEGDFDVADLPISRHFDQDAGRYIGSGILVCKDPDTGVRNLSYQRLQMKGPARFGASLHSRGHIWQHLLRCEELGQNLEVAVVLGAPPAVHLAGAAKAAMEVDEYDIAGGLLGRPVELVKCQSIDVEVPASAEIVLEGEILANTHEDEGPFGEYTGYSTSRSTHNVFVVKAITRRRAPIYLDVIPGYSAEHLLLGRSAKEAHVFHRLKEIVPQVRALNYPRSGTHFHAYLSLQKSAEGQARHALMALLGLDNYIKFAVAVDEDIDVFNEEAVLWAIATRFQADTDMFVVPKVLCNRLDPSAVDGMSAKLGIDATAPLDWDVERTSVDEDAVAEARRLLQQYAGN
ncbi:MAG TPA: UbiD family decarboxylase [Candidatus Sulfomarinibacteraceae bacterium]|nr:UbiD family decarboxylase [Candidatus Sulfomarinibacteraceae bacterium]